MMMEILRKLFCKHEWELKHKLAFYDNKDELPVSYQDVYICKKCLRKHIIKY